MSDSILREFINVLGRFPVGIFEKESLRSFWINGFADVDELVLNYFSSFKECEHYKDLPKLLEDACCVTEKLIDHFASINIDGSDLEENHERETTDNAESTNNSSSSLNSTFGSGPWSALSKNNIGQQSVLAFLFVFLQTECNSDFSASDRQLCLLSARLYLDLLCLPGCNAYGIFHDTIFQNSINCLGLKGTSEDIGPQQQCVTGRGKHGNKGRNKARVKQKTSRKPILSDSDDEMEENGDDGDASCNSQKRKTCNIPINVQKKLILEILFSLENVVRSVPLKQHLGVVVEKLVELSTWDTEIVPAIARLAPERRAVSRAQTKNISSQAYRNLIVLCNPICSTLHITFCNIFAYFLPCVIMSGAGNAQTIPRDVVLLKEKVTEFVVYLIQKFAPDVLPAAKIFVQHASTKLAERAEFRNRVSQSVIMFIQNFPDEERVQMIEWFLKLNKSTKTGHRVFSLEVLSSLIKDSDCIPEQATLVSRMDLLKAIVERIDDKSAVVSSKAMSLLSTDHNHLKYLLDQPNCSIEPAALFDVVVESCNCEKSVIRKAAIQLLESFICHNQNCMTKRNLKTISDRAQDINVSVQKQASISMTKILETYPESDQVQDAWLVTQLPLVCADESSVQEKSLEMIENTIIQPMLKGSELSWSLLVKVSNGAHQDKQQYLRRAFSVWLRQNKFKPNDSIRCIRGKMNTCYTQAAWMILTFLTLGNKLTKLDFLLDSCLEEMRREDRDVLVLKRILQVVSQTTRCIPENDLEQLLQELTSSCKKFGIPVQILPSAFQAIEKIMIAIFDKNSDKKKEEWCASIFQEIDKTFLTSVILEKGYRPDLPATDEETLVRCIFTVGEIFQLCPWLLPSKFKLVIHSLVGRPIASEDFFSPNAFPFRTPPEPGSISAKIKAHAIISWGKLCIGDMDFCKSSLLTAIKELQESSEPSVRNNIAVALSDLLIFHPNLTEPYVPNLTACLRDDSELVRRQTLLVLARLLKEDYIKWKGTLFYRVLLCYVDDSREIVKMAEYCLLQLLLKRQPHSFGHHFVECVYYLNSYTRNEAFNQFPSEPSKDERFSLRNSPEKRFTLYKLLLRNMPDQERFQLHNQLCQDVLIPLMDGVFPLDKDSSDVIKDTLCVLSCEEIKLTPLAGMHEEEDEEEAELRADAKKIITALIRKQVVQAVLPVIISLKTFLESAHSPLICYLEKFLKEFLKDFKNELKDILGEDKQLAKEIEYILKSD